MRRLREQLQHALRQLQALKQVLRGAQLRAEVFQAKEAQRRVAASLLEALAAWLRPMMLQDLASEDLTRRIVLT